jgi:hypothetical protein
VLYANLKRGALLPNISMVPSSRPADSSRRPGSAVGRSLGRGEVVEGDDPYPSRTKSFAGLYVPIAAIGTCRSAKPGRQASSAAASPQAAANISHRQATARLPVTSIRKVLIAEVKPPNSAVARL